MTTSLPGFAKYSEPEDLEPGWLLSLRMFLRLPYYPGARITWKRLVNCYRNR